jgi:hypothetical protein
MLHTRPRILQRRGGRRTRSIFWMRERLYGSQQFGAGFRLRRIVKPIFACCNKLILDVCDLEPPPFNDRHQGVVGIREALHARLRQFLGHGRKIDSQLFQFAE